MSGLFKSSGNNQETIAEKLSGLQIQTSSYGSVIPIVYGSNRVAGNVIDYSDFQPIAHTETTQTGGKGGGATSDTNTTWTYTTMAIIAICEGNTYGSTSIGKVWVDKDITDLTTLGASYYAGGRPQSSWPYLTSNHPDKDVAYFGTAYVAKSDFDLGSSGSMKNHSFEIRGNYSISSENPDANPADIIEDFLGNAYYGCGWNINHVASLAGYRTYCDAAGLHISPVLDTQRQAKDWIQEWLTASNSEAVWSGSGSGMALKIIPYADSAITSPSGITYTPDTTIRYDLTPDDFLVSGPEDEPITVEIKSLSDTFNMVPIQFKDRSIDYNNNNLEDVDQVDVDLKGERKHDSITLNCITKSEVALKVSMALIHRSLYCRNKYSFKLPFKYVLLEPMDFISLTEPKMGLDHVPARIRSIDEDEEGNLSIEAEEWPFGTGTTRVYSASSESGGSVPVSVNVEAGPANAPVIFDVPALYRKGSSPEIIIGTSGDNKNWGGCNVYMKRSSDSSYSYAGQISGRCVHGVLGSNLNASADVFDTTSILDANFAASGGSIAGVSHQAALDLNNMIWVGGELIAVEEATLTATNRYSCHGLRRGAYGTAPVLHSTGSSILRMTSNVLRVSLPDSAIGIPLSIKLVSFNTFCGALQDISTCAEYTFTPTTQSLPVASNVSVSVLAEKPTIGALTTIPNASSAIVSAPKYIRVSWSLNTASQEPKSWQIVVYSASGSASDESSWLFPAITVDGAARSVNISYNPASSGSISVAVRGIYGV